MHASVLESKLPTGIMPAPRKRGRWQNISQNIWCYLYLLPLLALFLAFVVYPIFASAGYTLYNWAGVGNPTQFVGLQNFQQVMTDPFFWQAFLHTFLYTAVLVPVQLCLALILALVLNNPKLRFTTFYRSIYFIPVVTSAAVVGVVIEMILTNFGGIVGQFLMQLHIIQGPIDWLGDPHFALGVIIAVGIWQTLGYNLVYFLAALQTVPVELYEAAEIDGANASQRFFRITVPLLRTVGMVILMLAILGSLQVFDLVQVMTGGGPYFATNVVSTYIYQTAFGFNVEPNVGYASAAGFFNGLLLLGFTGLQVLFIRLAARRRTTAA